MASALFGSHITKDAVYLFRKVGDKVKSPIPWKSVKLDLDSVEKRGITGIVPFGKMTREELYVKAFKLTSMGFSPIFHEINNRQEASSQFRQFIFTSWRQFRKDCFLYNAMFLEFSQILVQDPGYCFRYFTMNLTGSFGCFTQ